MSGQADRDRAVEAVLRRAHARPPHASIETPPGACLDPETLALWVDDDLSAADRAAAERHVADCARCQAALVALARTVPVPERRPWWQSRAAWLAPLAAAAAALAIWVAVPGAPPPRSPERPPAASAPAVALPRPAEQEAEKAPASEVAAAPPPATAPAPAANAAAAPRALSEAVATDATSKSAGQANAIAAEIVSPDPMTRWRITGGRVVEHSTDRGATWQEQPTGTTSMLAAGSAPSPLVCWVVGQDGVVLLSTDGRTWRRLAFPATTALVSVRAADERTATVTDVNGRTYATTDGGVRWTQGQ